MAGGVGDEEIVYAILAVGDVDGFQSNGVWPRELQAVTCNIRASEAPRAPLSGATHAEYRRPTSSR